MVKKNENKAIIQLGLLGAASGKISGIVIQKNNVLRGARQFPKSKKKQKTWLLDFVAVILALLTINYDVMTVLKKIGLFIYYLCKEIGLQVLYKALVTAYQKTVGH